MMPDSGSATSEPSAADSRIKPSWAGLTPNSSRNCGIREAQLAKANPFTMKTA